MKDLTTAQLLMINAKTVITSNIMKKCNLYLIVVVLSGCSSTPEDREIALFRHKHKEDFKNYKYLQPTSVNACRAIAKEEAVYSIGTMRTLEQRYDKINELTNFTERAIQGEINYQTNLIHLFDVYDEMATNGATIFYFDWTNGKWSESGFISFKNGEIVRRDPMP